MFTNIRNRVASMAVVAVLMASLVVPARAQDYSDAPPVLKDEIEDAVETIIEAATDDPDDLAVAAFELEGSWPQIVFYAVADAITLNREGASVRSLSPYQYYVETARTDKQVGASSGSSGSTSALEKPGIPSLIGFAIENGAIDQEVSGTGLTLSSSPYSLMRLMTPDTQGNFRDYRFWRRIGVSVTYSLDDQQSTTTGDEPIPLKSLDTNEISEWSLRFSVLGDRSARSAKSAQLWKDQVQPLIQQRLDALTKGIAVIINRSQALKLRQEALLVSLGDSITRLLENSTVAFAERKEDIVNLILSEVGRGIFEPVNEGLISIDQRTRDKVNNEIVPTLLATQGELSGMVEKKMGGIIEEVNKAPLLTLSFTKHMADVGISNHSDFKLLFEGHQKPFNVIINAGLGIYHDPDEMLNQSTVRDFSVGLSLEAEFNNAFTRNLTSGDFSKITFSFTARYRRMEEVDDGIGVVQAKLDIPVTNGVSLPLSVTYATRTELIEEEEVRGNFGITFDLDKLFALAHSRLPQQ